MSMMGPGYYGPPKYWGTVMMLYCTVVHSDIAVILAEVL